MGSVPNRATNSKRSSQARKSAGDCSPACGPDATDERCLTGTARRAEEVTCSSHGVKVFMNFKLTSSANSQLSRRKVASRARPSERRVQSR